MRTVRTPRILAVDDRHENLVALQAILEGLLVSLDTVDTGEAALKKLLVRDYAAILLDAQMPGMDGFETAAHIKQRERTRNIPIIFLTAADYDPKLAFRGYQLGAVDYLTKPFDPWVLQAKVTVFAELWKAHTELASQVVKYAKLRDAVDTALTLLDHPDPQPADAVKILRAGRNPANSHDSQRGAVT
ncbi:MAG: response regulator [Pseudonocardia sp.]|nr:response regulator [Pseudonocardia sp.]